MAVVETIDFDKVFEEITARQNREREARLRPPLVRLWDGNWNLRGTVKKENNASFQFLDNEVGKGIIEMPIDYYLSQWAVNVKKRSTTNIHVTCDKDGARWSGRLEVLRVIKNDDGSRYVRMEFDHDIRELDYILFYSNPFLPPEVQFPRLWVLFGRARWCVKTSLLCNIMRLESSLWALPDNPLDPRQWNNFNQSTWSMVVKPDLDADRSVGALVHSRFKTAKDATKNIMADAQLSWECRRYLDGDEPPFPGANLRHGTLVWDVVDKSGWNTGTSFEGNLFTGLVSAFTNIGADGMTEGRDLLPDPNMPVEYYTPGYKGTLPSVPGVIFRESEHTAVQSSEWAWRPSTAAGIVAGGHSMPGVV